MVKKISPVLTNNILVTESIPLWVRENSTKEYTFENLKVILPQVYAIINSLEYTSNPACSLYNLPYLMQYEHEGAELARFCQCFGALLLIAILKSPLFLKLGGKRKTQFQTRRK
jgi:hypothetical protein